jgi:hypothetical protein
MIIDINGLGSMLAVRKGSPDMLPGTTVEITCREQPPFFDYWTDPIRLIEVLDGYALACEFPIEGRCDIQEIVDHILIEPVVKPRPHETELFRARQYTVIEQDFQEIHSDLVGIIRAGFITDESGTPCVENLRTKWTMRDDKTLMPIVLHSKTDGSMIAFNRTEGQTCVDGILVCGEPGRRRRSLRLGHQSNRITLGRTSFVLDARSTLKPTLTPARTVPDRNLEFDVRWRRLQDVASRALGRLWEKVTERMLGESHAETYWQLCQIYGVPPMTMRAEAVWRSVLFPVVAADDKTCRLRFLHDVGRVIVRGQEKEPRLETVDGFIVAPTEAMTRWDWDETTRISEFYVRASLLTMARLVQHGDELWLDFPAPLCPDEALLDSWIQRGPLRFQFPLIRYGPGLETLLTAKLPVETANRDHPLIRIMMVSMYTEDGTALQQFAHAAVRCLSDSDTLNALAADKPAGEWRKYVGHLYNAVDWTEVNTALRPPYRIRLDGTAEIEISADHFQD